MSVFTSLYYQITSPPTSRYCIPIFILQRVTFILVCPGAVLAYAHGSSVIVSDVSRLSQSFLVLGDESYDHLT